MADTFPTLWEADPHTVAKHAILRRYLLAWFPILSQQSSVLGQKMRGEGKQEILYIDGFAGPGEYLNGFEGSPIIALKSALNHQSQFPNPIRMVFIEARKDRFDHLQSVLAPHKTGVGEARNISAVEAQHGECDTLLDTMLTLHETKKTSFGPALAFLDQFGYGDISMKLISRILRFGQCEVFSYLEYKNMNRWIADPTKAPAFTRAYGGEEWRGALNLPERDRRTFLLEQYKAALKNPARGNAKYVVSFSMFDKNGLPLYWLFFCTNHIRGLEEMKRAMWAVDKTGDFRFSDKDNPDQLPMFEQAFDDAWLSGELSSRHGGKSRTAAEVKEYVLTETPCCLFKTALASMENDGSIIITKQPAGRRRGTFPDDDLERIELTFQIPLFS